MREEEIDLRHGTFVLVAPDDRADGARPARRHGDHAPLGQLFGITTLTVHTAVDRRLPPGWPSPYGGPAALRSIARAISRSSDDAERVGCTRRRSSSTRSVALRERGVPDRDPARGVDRAAAGSTRGALARGALYLVIGVGDRLADGLRALVQHDATASTSDGVHFTDRHRQHEADDGPARAASRGSTPWPGPVQRLFGVVALHVQTGRRRRQGRDRARGGRAGARSSASARRCATRPESPRRAAAPPQRAPAAAAATLLVAALTAGQLGVDPAGARGVGAAAQQRVSSERDVEDATRLLPDTRRRVGARRSAALLVARVGAVGRSARSSRSRASRSRATATGCGIRRGLLQRARGGRAGAAHRTPCASSRACCGARSGSRRCASRSTGYAEEAAAARTLFPLLRRAEVARVPRRAAARAGRRARRPRRRRRARAAAPLRAAARDRRR